MAKSNTRRRPYARAIRPAQGERIGHPLDTP
jgi:hypothetical protein